MDVAVEIAKCKEQVRRMTEHPVHAEKLVTALLEARADALREH